MSEPRVILWTASVDLDELTRQLVARERERRSQGVLTRAVGWLAPVDARRPGAWRGWFAAAQS